MPVRIGRLRPDPGTLDSPCSPLARLVSRMASGRFSISFLPLSANYSSPSTVTATTSGAVVSFPLTSSMRSKGAALRGWTAR